MRELEEEGCTDKNLRAKSCVGADVLEYSVKFVRILGLSWGRISDLRYIHVPFFVLRLCVVEGG